MFTICFGDIDFKDGYYYIFNTKGECSILTKKAANAWEADKRRYNASMTASHGGLDEDETFRKYGLIWEDEEWILKEYETDQLMDKDSSLNAIAGKWTVPAQVGGKNVNYIEAKAFYRCEELEEVIIPEYIKEIGFEAFIRCTHLKRVTIGEGVHVIPSDAFRQCSQLEQVILPPTIEEIEGGAFMDTGIMEHEENWIEGGLYIGQWLISVKEDRRGHFEIKDGTVGIADEAFMSCSQLTSVTMPDSIKYMGDRAFFLCSSLEKVNLSKNIRFIRGEIFVDCNRLTKIRIPKQVQEMSDQVFSYCEALENVIIENPEMIIEGAIICDCPKVTIHALKDSTASEYARKENLSLKEYEL